MITRPFRLCPKNGPENPEHQFAESKENRTIRRTVCAAAFALERFLTIDHFHYDVTRAKVSGSCSKDRAQCRAIAGKCQKISRSAMSAKASYQVFYKVMCSIATKIQRNLAWSCLYFLFFDKRGIAKCC